MSEREKVSAVIICYNEEKKIRECLESVRWADEIVVVDSFSRDRTMAIVSEFTERVWQHKYDSEGAQRNWAIGKASHNWILMLDADERVSPELRREIEAVLESAPIEHSAFSVGRVNDCFGKRVRYGGWGRESLIRLFRRDRCRHSDRQIHFEILVEGSTGRLQGCLVHDTYRDLDEYFVKFHGYTKRAVEDLLRQGRKAGILELGARPVCRFLRMYFLRVGFLDGKVGLILAYLAAFNVFTKYARLWERQRIVHEEARPTQS